MVAPRVISQLLGLAFARGISLQVLSRPRFRKDGKVMNFRIAPARRRVKL
jgi:hypothetical protein